MHRLILLLAGPLAVVLAGCGPKAAAKSKPVDPAQERLIVIGQAYRQFTRDRHEPPKAASDLAPILKQRGHGTDALESARDGQPFVVCWGVDPKTASSWARSRPVLAYEREGQAGSRYVLSMLGNVELLNDEQFRESSFPPGHQPGK
jgi:hypothetical protein